MNSFRLPRDPLMPKRPNAMQRTHESKTLSITLAIVETQLRDQNSPRILPSQMPILGEVIGSINQKDPQAIKGGHRHRRHHHSNPCRINARKLQRTQLSIKQTPTQCSFSEKKKKNWILSNGRSSAWKETEEERERERHQSRGLRSKLLFCCSEILYTGREANM